VGSEHQDAAVDVRFISATNRNPRQAVAEGLLRGDLFYRLRVVLIKLPPLRERVEDIPLLANHFLGHYWNRYRRTREPAPTFTPESMAVLEARQWPGNVRELQNVIEHIAALAEPGQPVRPDDIPSDDEPADATSMADVFPPALLEQGYYSARDTLVADFERVYLSRLVSRAGGNMSKAARMANIDRSSLYRLIKRHSVPCDDADTESPE
jgi:DNA-binding NtrC family response regulator